MFYYLYQIQNTLNGKIYIGVHSTKDINNGYMGSGSIIKSEIKRYGRKYFTKTVLENFENKQDMYAREAEVVTKEFLLREDVYNKSLGGYGGFPDPKGLVMKTHSLGKLTHSYFGNRIDDYLQKANSVEALEKKKETWKKTKHSQGVNNSQFGTMWITNGCKNYKIKSTSSIPDGWRRGRVIYIPVV